MYKAKKYIGWLINLIFTILCHWQNYDTKNRIGMIMGGKEDEYAGAQPIGVTSLTDLGLMDLGNLV